MTKASYYANSQGTIASLGGHVCGATVTLTIAGFFGYVAGDMARLFGPPIRRAHKSQVLSACPVKDGNDE